MGTFWATEAIPIPITSLIPIIAFPAMNIMTAKQVGALYFKVCHDCKAVQNINKDS